MDDKTGKLIAAIVCIVIFMGPIIAALRSLIWFAMVRQDGCKASAELCRIDKVEKWHDDYKVCIYRFVTEEGMTVEGQAVNDAWYEHSFKKIGRKATVYYFHDRPDKFVVQDIWLLISCVFAIAVCVAMDIAIAFAAMNL